MIFKPTIFGQYVKKAIPIQVLEAFSSDYIRANYPNLRWEKTEIGGGEVYNQLHNSWIKFRFGDIFNITDDKDVYPIDRGTFFETYDPYHQTLEENIGN